MAGRDNKTARAGSPSITQLDIETPQNAKRPYP